MIYKLRTGTDSLFRDHWLGVALFTLLGVAVGLCLAMYVAAVTLPYPVERVIYVWGY